jgi:hypothetical protein
MGDFCCEKGYWFDGCHFVVNETGARCFFVLMATLSASNLSEESSIECALGLERLIEMEMPWLILKMRLSF